MGPRHYTAENVVPPDNYGVKLIASMGPRHYTAENLDGWREPAVMLIRLQWGRGITPRKTERQRRSDQPSF